MSQVAQEIIRQIRSISRCALMSWGAKDYVSENDALHFTTTGFKIKNRNSKVIIRLMPDDTYTITLGYVDMRRVEWVEVVKHSMIYAESLVSVIDDMLTRKAA